MISVVVKGNKEQSLLAAQIREIPCVFQREVLGFSEESVILVEDCHVTRVARWLAENDKSPFPIGTCLIYSFQKTQTED